MSKCLICQKECKNDRSLASHLQTFHKITTKEYTIKFVYNNEPPKCLICQGETRYLLFSFKKFCREHIKEAEKAGGKLGGIKKQTWNKGQTKETNEVIRKQAEGMMGEKNHFYGKKHLSETIEHFKIVQKTTKNDFLFYNKRNDTSKPQRDLFELITSWNFICEENNNTIIAPKHLDVFVPSKNFAIEYNGLYWHQEEKNGKRYHLDKTIACQKANIELFHIFEDEWTDKRLIIESMLRHRLGITLNKVFGRKCSVKEVDNKVANVFLDETHISGHTKARKAFGLFSKDGELLSVLSFKKPIQKKYENTIEIARYATQLNTSIIGGFSKLFNFALKWIKTEGYEKVLTYSDRRFGQGNTYKLAGFEKIGETPIDYWYASERECKRYFRFKFRAQPGKTEKQVAEENEVFPVYGCGSFIWTYDIK